MNAGPPAPGAAASSLRAFSEALSHSRPRGGGALAPARGVRGAGSWGAAAAAGHGLLLRTPSSICIPLPMATQDGALQLEARRGRVLGDTVRGQPHMRIGRPQPCTLLETSQGVGVRMRTGYRTPKQDARNGQEQNAGFRWRYGTAAGGHRAHAATLLPGQIWGWSRCSGRNIHPVGAMRRADGWLGPRCKQKHERCLPVCCWWGLAPSSDDV